MAKTRVVYDSQIHWKSWKLSYVNGSVSLTVNTVTDDFLQIHLLLRHNADMSRAITHTPVDKQ